MRFTVSSEELKNFRTLGYVELEDLLTEKESASLITAINKVHKNTPGYSQEHLYRSIPLIGTIARKQGWGQIVYEFFYKKPLSIEYDKFYPGPPTDIEAIEEDSCGLLLNLKTRKGCFFKQFPTTHSLYNGEGCCYFYLILTSKHLPERLNPIIFR